MWCKEESQVCSLSLDQGLSVTRQGGTALHWISRFRTTKVKGKTQDCVGIFFCFLYCNSDLQVTNEHSFYGIMIETYHQLETN